MTKKKEGPKKENIKQYITQKRTEMKTKSNKIYSSLGNCWTCYPSFGLANRPLAKLSAHAMEASRSGSTESLLSTLPPNQQISISSQEIDRDLAALGLEK